MSSHHGSKVMEAIKHFATFPQKSVTLRQMIDFGRNPSQGRLLQASEFLRRELPVRLAHRVVELDSLPHKLNKMPSILRVKQWYIDSFQELVDLPKVKYPKKIKLPPLSSKAVFYAGVNLKDDELPPDVEKINASFVDAIDKIKKRHDPVTATIAQGVNELKESLNTETIPDDIQHFLDRFHMSRIGIRFLIGQHIGLSKPSDDSHVVGIIDTNTNIADVVQEAIMNSRWICKDYYDLDEAPKVALYCEPNLNFPYVPSHLHHILFELLKNSLRATVEFHGKEKDDFPDVRIIVAQGDEDLTIKISDEGGGIPRSGIAKVWGYSYTTAKNQLPTNFQSSDFKAPMAGFGYGLPLSRLYARYFGGDLVIISMEGYGTDAYIHLSRLGDGEEPLP